jgi:hypothetical protein
LLLAFQAAPHVNVANDGLNTFVLVFESSLGLKKKTIYCYGKSRLMDTDGPTLLPSLENALQTISRTGGTVIYGIAFCRLVMGDLNF